MLSQTLMSAIGLLAVSCQLYAQPRTIAETNCRGSCGLVVRDSFALRFPDEAPLPGLPRLIKGSRRGQIFVITTRNALPDGPPQVFSHIGEFIGTLGKRGRGPGESEHPDWIDAELDDSIRVVESERLYVFGPDLRLASSVSMTRWITRPTQVVALTADRFVALGTGAVRPGSVRPIEVIGNAGATAPNPFAARVQNEQAGTHQILARSRRERGTSIWVGRFSLNDGAGYDLETVGARGRESWRRRPAWWVSKHLSAATSSQVPIVTRLADIRELSDGRIAVLIAQPSSDERRRSAFVKPRTGAGWWNRYDTILEVVDVVRGELVAQSVIPGFPRGFVADDRVAIYSEPDDEPRIQIVELTRIP